MRPSSDARLRLRVLALLAALLPALGPAAPGDLILTDRLLVPNSCDFGGCPIAFTLDPATGTTGGLGAGADGTLFTDVSAGADGSVAISSPLELGVYHAPPAAALAQYRLLPFVSNRVAVEPNGDLLLEAQFGGGGGPPDGLYRYRVRFDTLELVSAGSLSDVALGAAGEIYLVTNGATAIETADAGTGARTPLASGGLLGTIRGIAVEPGGDLVALDASFGVVRIDASTGTQSLVSSGGGIETGNGIAAAADGTLFVTLPGAGGLVTPDGAIVRVEPTSGAQSVQAIDRGIFDPFAIASVSCTEQNGACQPPVECTVDADCDDGLACTGADACVAGRCQAGADLCPGFGAYCAAAADACVACTRDASCVDGAFCNGVESCDDGFQCLPGTDPCPGQLCDESLDACVACLTAGDCDDGLFCNGQETCAGGACAAGTAPCTAPFTCDEATDQCVAPLPADFDLLSLRVTGRVRVGGAIGVRLKVRNLGTATETGEVTLAGAQNGQQVFFEQRLVTLVPGERRWLEYSFTPAAAGNVTWTASVADANPDADVLTATSRVLP
jgi:hypothetical protein